MGQANRSEYHKAYAKAHRAHRTESHRLYRVRNPGREAAARVEYRLRSKYGISYSDFARMLYQRRGRCDICRATPVRLCVDHDHQTGKIRGLLCNNCNTAIGLLGDSLVRLSRTCTYIERNLYATSGTALQPGQCAA